MTGTRRARRGTALAIVGAALACATGLVSGAAAQETEATPVQVCYFGEIRRTTPDGEQAGVAAALLRRTETPATNLIVEQVLMIERGEAPRESITMYQVTGDEFVMVDRAAAFNGQGRFAGEPWRWTSWTYSLDLRGGTGTIRATATATPDGLTVQKRYFSPSGELRMLMDESYRRIGCDVHAVLFQRLLGG